MVAVIGGGLSGLSAGYYYLKRFGKPLTIYERSNRLGGWLRTESHPERGFIFEMGPHTIRPAGLAGANTLEMINDLGLPVDVILKNHASARNRLIYANGNLHPLPSSLFGAFRTQPPFTKPLISALLNDLFAGRKTSKIGDESILQFAQRRFGTEIAELAISPLICGICAGDAKEISVRLIMDELFEKEQQWGSVVMGVLIGKLFGRKRSSLADDSIFAEKTPTRYKKRTIDKWSMYRVRDGLENFPKALGNYLRDNSVDIRTASDCTKITFTRREIKMIVQDREVQRKYIISALPSHKLASCIRHQHPSLAGLLCSIPYVDVAVINLQYNDDRIIKKKAFGFLVPPAEKLPLLGVIFDSCCFDMYNNTVLTVMMGGKWFKENFGESPTQKDLLDIALRHVDNILDIDCEPKMTRVHTLRNCIPQYTVGHKRRVEDIRSYLQYHDLPMSVCGAAYDGVGINDVILSARRQIGQLEHDQS